MSKAGPKGVQKDYDRKQHAESFAVIKNIWYMLDFLRKPLITIFIAIMY